MTITVRQQRYRLKVERFYASEQIERYRVTGGQKSIEVQTNRPFLKKMNRRQKFKWKLIKGDVYYGSTLETILRELEYCVEQYEKEHPNE